MNTPHGSQDPAGVDVVPLRPRARSHEPEPEPGSLRTGNGQGADLFNVRHYPVRALCRLCGKSIKATSFFRPFEHASERHA